MISRDQAQALLGHDAYSAEGERIGEVVQAFLDDSSGEPKWATVRTGLLGARDRVVPLAGAEVTPEGLALPYPRDLVRESPDVSVDSGHIAPEEEDALYAYYGTGAQARSAESGLEATDDAMTRSEERLVTGVETVVGARARVEKYVVTETETVTVQVRREKVRLVSEPVEESDTLRAPADGTEFQPREQVLVLYAERPVVTLETVPVERVRVVVEPETTDATVTAPVRKERIELTTEEERVSR
ncbi:DUF2382 domain-containing protein [Motilibacter deserti]|uniref:DUF2382 domain-containing protein n=1 Tax=Motilibacter deserti TaxID=2714956 RepID=A0ABX0GRU3_9ACTN|nr:DUF2382 domain-containing protein [Motilibacter deserti]NHC13210.1 DUF2382 domain-containing protein [Motilibacter deserti]